MKAYILSLFDISILRGISPSTGNLTSKQEQLKSYFERARKREERHKKLLRIFNENFEQFKDVFFDEKSFFQTSMIAQKIKQAIQKNIIASTLEETLPNTSLSGQFVYAQADIPEHLEKTLTDEAKEIENQVGQAKDTKFIGPLQKKTLELRRAFAAHPKNSQRLKEEFLLSHGIMKTKEEGSYLFSEERIKKMRDRIQYADNSSANLTRVFIFSQIPTQMENREYLAKTLDLNAILT